jgi:hypothetical protein
MDMPIPPPDRPSTPPPSSQQPTPAATPAAFKGHAFSSDISPLSLPQELVAEVFTYINKHDFFHANELMQQFQDYKNNPEHFDRQVAELLSGAKASIEQRHDYKRSPTHKRLLSALEKIEFAWFKKRKGNPLHLLRGAKLLRKASQYKKKFREFAEELAATDLPESHAYVLESSWLALITDVRHIYLAGISFSVSSLKAFLLAVELSGTLLSLTLSACKVLEEGGDRLFNDEEVQLITPSTKNHPSLKKLVLSHNEITAASLPLFTSLSTSLSSLDLTGNDLDNRGVDILADMLASPSCSLRELVLDMASLSGKGIAPLTEKIKGYPTLQRLSLAANNITDDGAVALSEAAHRNKTLVLLDLSGNMLTAKGMKILQHLHDERIIS